MVPYRCIINLVVSPRSSSVKKHIISLDLHLTPPLCRYRCVQDALRVLPAVSRSPPYYSPAQVTRGRNDSPPLLTSRLFLRTPPHPWLQKASFFMPSKCRFRVGRFPLAQVNRTRNRTKERWLTVVLGPCVLVTFCLLMAVCFCIVCFNLHGTRL